MFKPETRSQARFIRQLITRDIPSRLAYNHVPRNHGRIQKEYSGRWEGTQSNVYYGSTKLYPTILHGEFAMLSGFEYIARHIRIISKYIRRTNPMSVLELGSGNGLNLLALAVLCPEVETFTGVELTEQGVKAARALQADPPIDALCRICEMSVQEVVHRLSSVKVDFVRGDITRLPQESNSFEFVFSFFVLEQLPREYVVALDEAFRVTTAYALFVEAFREAQASFMNRAWLWSRDYFCQPIEVVEKAGFKVEEYVPLEFRKFTHGGGAVLCSKQYMRNEISL